MNKKKFNISNYFSGKLFCEAFKQLRVVGIASLICLNALAIFLPVISYLERKDEFNLQPGRILFQTNGIMLPLAALVFIVTPIMFLMLFGFLTKRSGSDFYHSLPVKRSCMFFTFVTAIISWLFILTTTYGVFSVISANICYEHFIIDYSTVISYSTNIFVGCILIIGVFTIGTALTGSMTSNMFFSFGILLLPRIIIAVLSSLFISYSPSFTNNAGYSIFKPLINIPFSMIASIFTVEESSFPLIQLGEHTIYTIIIAIIYVFIGMKLFASRPSEVATKSFRSKKVFSVFKITTGFCISLLMVTTLYPALGNEDLGKWISEQKISIMFTTLAIAMSMFALETANTKSIKKGLKTLLITPAIIAADIVILFGLYSLDKHVNNETLDKNKVEYVYVGDFYATYILHTDEYSCDYSMYCAELINQLKVTDDEVIDLFVNAYNSGAGKEDRERRHGIMSEVTFDYGFSEKTRYVYFSTEEANKLVDILLKNEDIQKCFYNFPELNNSAIGSYDILPQDCDKLYSSLIKELNNLSFEQLYQEYCITDGEYNYEHIDSLYIETFINGSFCSIDFPITSLTTETYALGLECSNRTYEDLLEKNIDSLKNFTSSDNMYFNFSAYNILPDGKSNKHYYSHTNDNDLFIKEKIHHILPYLTDALNGKNTFTAADITDENTLICNVYIGFPGNSCTYYFTIPTDSPIIDGLENLYDEDYYEEY